MDQPAPLTAPYFDFDLLRQEAAELAHSHSGQDSTLRMALVERLRRLVEDARTAARRQLERDGDGRACADVNVTRVVPVVNHSGAAGSSSRAVQVAGSIR